MKRREDAVTVKVYRSEVLGLTAGHITLETYPRSLPDGELRDGIYIDFRPREHKRSQPVVGGIIKKKSSSGRPDVVVHLYGLNIAVIEDIWTQIKGRIAWGLLSKFKTDTESKSIRHNSASLCLLLLYFGGITNSHSVQLSNTCKSFFDWCGSALRIVLHSLSIVAVGTAVSAELLTNSSVERRVQAALTLLPHLRESVEATALQGGIFMQKTAEIFSVTPGEIEELLLNCKRFQDEIARIKRHPTNLLEDAYSTNSCLML